MNTSNTVSTLMAGTTLQTIATLPQSSTSTQATNFAFSSWFFINDWNYNYGQEKPLVAYVNSSGIEGVGDGSVASITNSAATPAPTITFDNTANNINIYMTCGSSGGSHNSIQKFQIQNTPIQTWVNLVVSVYGTSMDVYLNGKLVNTFLLPGVAYINSKNTLYITPLGGFSGWTSNVAYYPNSLNPQDVWNIYKAGYGGSMLSNMLGSYKLNIQLQSSGVTTGSITL
jgi:hypothetical protein